MNSFFQKYFFLVVVLAQACIWLCVKGDPFFGDAIASTSRAAHYIYEHHMGTVFYPADADPGHPTFYSWLLAFIWTICGRTLAVSHLYGCIWALFLAFMFRGVASLFLERREVNIATVLLLLFPTYLSQSAMMLNTVALMSFFLLAVYGLAHRPQILAVHWLLFHVHHTSAGGFFASLSFLPRFLWQCAVAQKSKTC
jgi:hypothetical protein